MALHPSAATVLRRFGRTCGVIVLLAAILSMAGLPGRLPAAFGAPETGTITGRVVDPESKVGRPGLEAGMWLSKDNTATRIGPAVYTDGDGSFRFDRVTPGTYEIEVFEWATTDSIHVESKNVTVRAGETAAVEIPFPSWGKITVYATDPSGSPLEIAYIEISDGEVAHGTPGRPQQWPVTRALAPGTYTLRLYPTAHKPSEPQTVKVEAGKTAQVHLQLEAVPSGTLVGTVHLTAKAGYPHLLLLDATGQHVVRLVALGDKSQFRVEGLPAGTYLVWFMGGQGPRVESRVTIMAGQEVTLNLDQPVLVPVRVTDPQGKGVAGVRFIRDGEYLSAEPKGGGNYELAVAPGTMTVRVYAPGYILSRPATFDTNGRKEPVTFQLAPNEHPSTLRGRIADAQTGRPAGPLRLTLQPVDGSDSPMLPTLSGEGGYWIGDVPAGTYWLTGSNDHYAVEPQLIDLRRPRTLMLDLTAVPAGTLEYRVVDGAGKPVAGATVQAFRQDANSPYVITDMAGSGQLRLPIGTYSLEAEAPGLAADPQTVVIKPDAATALTVALAPVRPAEVRVSVVEPARRLRSPVQVYLTERRSHRRVTKPTLTDAAGSVTFTGLSPGSYEVVLTSDGFRSDPVAVDAPAGQSVDAQVVAHPYGTFSGTFVRGDGPPALGVSVTLTGAAGSQTYLTDIDGKVQVELPEETYSMHIDASGYVPLPDSTVTINAGEVVAPRYVLKWKASLRLSRLLQTYDGRPKPVQAIASPAEIGPVTLRYDGLSTPPVEPGAYPVQAVLDSDFYQAEPASGILIVALPVADTAEPVTRLDTPLLLPGTGWQTVAFQVGHHVDDRQACYYDPRFSRWIAVPTVPEDDRVTARLPAGLPVGLMHLGTTPPVDLAGHWAGEAMLQMLSLGAVAPGPDGLVHPDDPVSEAEALRMLFALKEFLHLRPDHPAVKAFPADGQAPVTRAEMGALVGALLPVNDTVPSLTDATEIPESARPAVFAAVTAEIMTTSPDGRFRPAEAMTRAQVAVVVSRLLERLVPQPPDPFAQP